MRIRQRFKKDRVIDVQSSFARILTIRRRSSDGRAAYYMYEFSYTVDQIAAIRDKIKTVRILIRKGAPKKEGSRWANDDTSQVVKPQFATLNVLKAATALKDLKLANTASPFMTIASPMKFALSPADANKVMLASDDDSAETFLPAQKVVVPKLVSQLKKSNSLTPILKVATNACACAGIIADPQPVNYNQGNLQSSALNLVLNAGVDPSAAFGVNVNVISSAKSFAGVQSKPSELQLKTGPKFVKLQPKKLTAFANILAKPTTVSSDTALVDDIEVPTIEKMRLRHVDVSRRVPISADVIGDNDTFHVEFKLIDSSNKIVGKVSRIVSHKRIVEAFETPRRPPVIKAAPAQVPGRNVIEIRQLDDQAMSVKMYRRSINSLTNINDPVDMAYEQAGEIPVSQADGMMKVVDAVNNTSPIIYRFIPVGPGGKIGSIFENIVVPGTRRTQKRRRRVITAALDVITEGEIAVIKITNIVKGPVAFGLQRRNRTIFEKEYEYITDKPIALADNNENLSFIDDNVKEDNIYEYRLVLYFEDGSEELSTGYFMYEHIPEDRAGVEITVSDPQVRRIVSKSRRRGRGVTTSRPGSTYDVVFSLQSNIDQLADDQLRATLSHAGLLDIYTDELKEDRDRLSDLIAHRVQRVNNSDGSLEDFGVVTGNVFSDVKAGSTKAVKPIHAGIKYRYIINTLLRSPETMFESFEKVKTSSQRIASAAVGSDGLTSQQYKFKPTKFLHPVTLKGGTLTTSTSRKSQRARDEFSYGIIGNAKSLEVTIPPANIQLARPIVQRFDKITNIVRWQAIGDVEIVDYFLIVFTHLGTDEVVGKVHAMNDTTSFEFFHDLEDVEVGTGSYTIRAMLTNFEQGPVLTTDKFTI